MGRLILGLVAVLVCHGPSRARADGQPLQLTGFFGIRTFSAASELGSPTDTSLANSVILGPRLARKWKPWLGFEAELPLVVTGSRDDEATVFFLDPRLQAVFEMEPIGNVRPFSALGFGSPIALSSNRPRFNSDLLPEGHLGLGAWFDRDKGWSVRVDARAIFLPARGEQLVTPEFELFVTIYRWGDEPEDRLPVAEEQARDPDGDQLYGTDDHCPNRTEDLDGFEDTDGCPDIDDDRDEILDIADKCRYEPEIWNGFRDHDGCPDDVPEEVAVFDGVLKGVRFKRGSDAMPRSASKALNRMAAVLVKYPSVRGRIVGHTDNDGNPKADIDLAQARAEAVKYYLVTKGVGEFRLGAVGVGAEKPIAEEEAKKASALSRRVEFQLRRRD